MAKFQALLTFYTVWEGGRDFCITVMTKKDIWGVTGYSRLCRGNSKTHLRFFANFCAAIPPSVISTNRLFAIHNGAHSSVDHRHNIHRTSHECQWMWTISGEWLFFLSFCCCCARRQSKFSLFRIKDFELFHSTHFLSLSLSLLTFFHFTPLIQLLDVFYLRRQ